MQAPQATDGFDERLRQRMASPSPRPLETIPKDPALRPDGRIPNTPLAASTISFLLGGTFALGGLTFLIGGFDDVWWATPQLCFYVAAWSFFHWAEFAVTAGWNPEKCSVGSFLLENGALYHIAHSVAVLEYLLTLYFKPSIKEHPNISTFGVTLAVAGQILRSLAMINAGSNFSHIVAYRKLNTHVLVTSGIYAWLRHPSYTGFFYWALGLQLVLQNPVSFAIFVAVLWRFFYHRIKGEEISLVRFFGNDYVQYRNRVGTWIPFIR
ncbi:ICMT-domain-containing protein [Obba rivulosa]|uniref:Protein-S-isoprenylcysteine O-methyltransferase n=1 Tax=Obba rivulosa TaxID=1052685 RepID=A0A8E2AYK3_9APHY|nr:ICMT-domain-containing protein [Obba rivulosa]